MVNLTYPRSVLPVAGTQIDADQYRSCQLTYADFSGFSVTVALDYPYTQPAADPQILSGYIYVRKGLGSSPTMTLVGALCTYNPITNLPTIVIRTQNIFAAISGGTSLPLQGVGDSSPPTLRSIFLARPDALQPSTEDFTIDTGKLAVDVNVSVLVQDDYSGTSACQLTFLWETADCIGSNNNSSNCTATSRRRIPGPKLVPTVLSFTYPSVPTNTSLTGTMSFLRYQLAPGQIFIDAITCSDRVGRQATYNFTRGDMPAFAAALPVITQIGTADDQPPYYTNTSEASIYAEPDAINTWAAAAQVNITINVADDKSGKQ